VEGDGFAQADLPCCDFFVLEEGFVFGADGFESELGLHDCGSEHEVGIGVKGKFWGNSKNLVFLWDR